MNSIIRLFGTQEKEIQILIRKRLTKKEFKIIKFMLDDRDAEDVMRKLNLDQERYDELKKSALKKLQNIDETLSQNLH